MKNFLFGCVALALATAPAIAQQAIVQQAEIVSPVVQKIEVNQDGSLSGNVYAKVASEETPVDAKITLAKEGVVIEAVQTENGSFSFANIAPGSYTLIGTTAGYSGAQTYEVGPYAGAGSKCNLGLQSTSNVVYQNSPVYDAPAAASSGCSSCAGAGSGGYSSGAVSSGGGGFGGGGGVGSGRLLGGRLGGRRLLRAGLIGGVVAVAVSGDDDVSAAE